MNTETLVLVLGFTILVMLTYRLWKPMREPPKRKVRENEATLYFFYTNWCGWSKKAMPEWQKLESRLRENNVFGTTKVTPDRVDADEDAKRAMLYEVKGFPTILLETSQGIYHYTKRPTEAGLLEFLRDTLGEPAAGL